MAKVPIIFFVLVCALTNSFALKDIANVFYKTRIGNTECKAATGRCCRVSSACSIAYILRGNWNTEVDDKPSFEACRSLCGRHRKKCDFACSCLAENKEVRSSKVCKCQRSVNEDFVRNNCIRRCIDAESVCVEKCVSGRSCPTKASTSIAWLQNFPGKCVEVCPRYSIVPTGLPLCPVVGTIAPAP